MYGQASSVVRPTHSLLSSCTDNLCAKDYDLFNYLMQGGTQEEDESYDSLVTHLASLSNQTPNEHVALNTEYDDEKQDPMKYFSNNLEDNSDAEAEEEHLNDPSVVAEDSSLVRTTDTVLSGDTNRTVDEFCSNNDYALFNYLLHNGVDEEEETCDSELATASSPRPGVTLSTDYNNGNQDFDENVCMNDSNRDDDQSEDSTDSLDENSETEYVEDHFKELNVELIDSEKQVGTNDYQNITKPAAEKPPMEVADQERETVKQESTPSISAGTPSDVTIGIVPIGKQSTSTDSEMFTDEHKCSDIPNNTTEKPPMEIAEAEMEAVKQESKPNITTAAPPPDVGIVQRSLDVANNASESVVSAGGEHLEKDCDICMATVDILRGDVLETSTTEVRPIEIKPIDSVEASSRDSEAAVQDCFVSECSHNLFEKPLHCPASSHVSHWQTPAPIIVKPESDRDNDPVSGAKYEELTGIITQIGPVMIDDKRYILPRDLVDKEPITKAGGKPSSEKAKLYQVANQHKLIGHSKEKVTDLELTRPAACAIDPTLTELHFIEKEIDQDDFAEEMILDTSAALLPNSETSTWNSSLPNSGGYTAKMDSKLKQSELHRLMRNFHKTGTPYSARDVSYLLESYRQQTVGAHNDPLQPTVSDQSGISTNTAAILKTVRKLAAKNKDEGSLMAARKSFPSYKRSNVFPGFIRKK